MPILDHLISELNDSGISVRDHENIRLRFIEHFQAIQHNLTVILSDNHKLVMDRVVTLLVNEISKKKRSGTPHIHLNELKDKWIGIKTDNQKLSRIGETTCTKWQKEGYNILPVDPSLTTNSRPSSYLFRFDMGGKDSSGSFLKYFANALAPNGSTFLFIQIDETSAPSPFIDNWLQLIYACNKIINPDIKVLLKGGNLGETINTLINKSWYHHASYDGYFNKAFTTACWDAIATQQTSLFRHTADRYFNTPDQVVKLYTIEPGYFEPKLDDEDIFASGYTPQPHRDFLVAYFTGKFKGSVSTARVVKAIHDHYILHASAPGLSGIERGIKLNAAEFAALGVKRIRMLETLAILHEGLPVFIDYDLPQDILQTLWLNRARAVKAIRIKQPQNTADVIKYLEVNNAHTLVAKKERYKNGLLGIFNFKNAENSIEWEELQLQAQISKTSKDLMGQKIKFRKGKLHLNPYDYYLLKVN